MDEPYLTFILDRFETYFQLLRCSKCSCAEKQFISGTIVDYSSIKVNSVYNSAMRSLCDLFEQVQYLVCTPKTKDIEERKQSIKQKIERILPDHIKAKVAEKQIPLLQPSRQSLEEISENVNNPGSLLLIKKSVHNVLEDNEKENSSQPSTSQEFPVLPSAENIDTSERRQTSRNIKRKPDDDNHQHKKLNETNSKVNVEKVKPKQKKDKAKIIKEELKTSVAKHRVPTKKELERTACLDQDNKKEEQKISTSPAKKLKLDTDDMQLKRPRRSRTKDSKITPLNTKVSKKVTTNKRKSASDSEQDDKRTLSSEAKKHKNESLSLTRSKSSSRKKDNPNMAKTPLIKKQQSKNVQLTVQDDNGEDALILPSSSSTKSKSRILSTSPQKTAVDGSIVSIRSTKKMKKNIPEKITLSTKRQNPKTNNETVAMTVDFNKEGVDKNDRTSEQEEDGKKTINDKRTPSKNKISKDDKRNKKGETLIHQAVIKGDIERVKKLIMNGHAVNTKDFNSWTPLHEASASGNIPLMEILIKSGANINAPGGEDHLPPLHDLIINEKPNDCIKILIENGADPSVKDKKGRTAFDLVSSSNKALQSILTKAAKFDKTISSTPIAPPIGHQRRQKQQTYSILFTGFENTRRQALASAVQKELNKKGVATTKSTNDSGIEECVRQKRWIEEEKYEVKGSAREPNSGGARRSRLKHEKNEPALFANCDLYLHGEFSTYKKDDVKELVKICGCKMLTREPKLHRIDSSENNEDDSPRMTYIIYELNVPEILLDNKRIKHMIDNETIADAKYSLLKKKISNVISIMATEIVQPPVDDQEVKNEEPVTSIETTATTTTTEETSPQNGFSTTNNNSNGLTNTDITREQSSSSIHQSSSETQINKNDLEPEALRKIFIGGLSYKTEDQQFRDHFSKYGDILDCIIMRDREGRSRGFGFVTYSTSAMIDNLMANRPHVLDGREIEPKRAVPREEASKPESAATAKKLFVGGIRDGITETDLNAYFTKYGNVIDSVVMKDATGKQRGFGFVEFDDYDPVDKIVLEKHHVINGQAINVEKALPKDQTGRGRGGMGNRNRGGPSRSNYGNNQGYGRNDQNSFGGGGYGDPPNHNMMGGGGNFSNPNMGNFGGNQPAPMGGYDSGFGANFGAFGQSPAGGMNNMGDGGFGQNYQNDMGGGPMRRGGPGGNRGSPYGGPGRGGVRGRGGRGR
ncbi:unnamed protein product [Didymodactylos carnosus]|uniref:RRM domain-containing protein n=1 Tax=Didymodactylos carnosus TaxID=1234261 RepID=A0A814H0N4_9BILA|nr:unnamed protein product [Didymodactylos carnosus]CAF1003745.1 unnamed protein product [Didymodactylos carnosus]CAF3645102.1 unnamed protein product [Didymodactylos carnosus]CAF3775129.1 unnamed protein product [Didymodactylos carnosus]